ncbi:MAG: TolC family protein [Bryobacteraceae bacterium]|nr:TolC family protein [Bryobacteraceae bacterium]
MITDLKPHRLLLLITLSHFLHAQTQSLSIGEAVTKALAVYPAARIASEQVRAATAGVAVAQTAWLPRLDTLAQFNRATLNNVFGLLLPQSTLPSISGPVLGTNDLDNVWSTAVGITASWEPFDFGLRKARLDEAKSSQHRAEAEANRTLFELSFRAADIWLTVLANEQAVRASEAGLKRAQALLTISDSLVRADLRPGVDASRGRAEVARSQTEILQARRSAEIARIELAGILNMEPATLAIVPGKLLQSLPVPAAPPAGEHPGVTEQKSAIAQVKAARTMLDRSWFPRFNLQGSAYARGTGALIDGQTLGGVNGLGPNYRNWAVGFTATFPLFDLASIRARTEVEAHRELAESARLDQIRQDLDANIRRTRLELSIALDIAQHTPVQVRSAREAEQQASARYKAGLSSVVDLTDAQRLLTQAEIEDSLARLTAWRALLRVSFASGDIDTFLSQASQ